MPLARRRGFSLIVNETPTGYAIHADPLKFNVNGKRTFYSDEIIIVHQHAGQEPATAEDEEAK